MPPGSGTHEITTLFIEPVTTAPTPPLATESQLVSWAEGGAYELLTQTYDAQNRLTGGSVKWPDGSGGALAISAWSGDGLPDAYTVTHTASNRTVTQSAVTRNASGDITAKPALTIAITS